MYICADDEIEARLQEEYDSAMFSLTGEMKFYGALRKIEGRPREVGIPDKDIDRLLVKVGPMIRRAIKKGEL